MILARFYYHIVCPLDIAWNEHAISSLYLDISHYTYFIIEPVNQMLVKIKMNALSVYIFNKLESFKIYYVGTYKNFII